MNLPYSVGRVSRPDQLCPLEVNVPELPEVETMRRGILGIQGATIVSAQRVRCRLKPISIYPPTKSFQRRVAGTEIYSVDRIGKRVVLRLDSEDAIVFEPRMTGLVLVTEPPNTAHLRFVLELQNASVDRLLFWDRRGLGSVRLLNQQELESELGPHRLGPDALLITERQMIERIGCSSRAIKVALLDQRAIAGVGNLYASEMLHLAGIDPRLRCDRLSKSQWQALRTAMRKILNKAIRYEGSTLADGTYRNALNDPGSYQNHHCVYARAGEACPTCGRGKIIRIVQAQRSTFFCEKCQRRKSVASRNRK